MKTDAFLKPHGLFFGQYLHRQPVYDRRYDRQQLRGTTSIKYGTTRDHVLELKTILSDGSSSIPVCFRAKRFFKQQGNKLENRLYRQIHEALSLPERRQAIDENYPKPSIHRRNTGYAIDVLAKSEIFTDGGRPSIFANFYAVLLKAPWLLLRKLNSTSTPASSGRSAGLRAFRYA